MLEFVRQSFPDAVGVGNVGKGQPRLALTGNAIKALEAAIEDAVASKTYADVTQALPTCVMPSTTHDMEGSNRGGGWCADAVV